MRVALAILALAFAAPAFAQDGGRSELAQPKNIKARAIPDKVKLGEPFTYELTITHDKRERWELAPPDPNALGDFDWIDQSRERTDGKDASVTTFKVRLQLFDLGQKTIPDLTFQVSDEQGTRKYVAKGIPVEGVSTLPPDADQKGASLFDIKGNADVPVRTYRLLWALLGLLAALALGYAAYKYFTRPKLAPLVPAAPPKALNVRTLEALDALKAEELPAKGRTREFYFRLSEILRGYLGERFQFEALECTGSELVAAVRGLNANLSIEALERFVLDSDLAKFAKSEPPPDVCAASLQYAYRVVHDTWVETPTPPSNAPRPAVP